MRNSVFDVVPGRRGSLIELLDNPIFSNVVRLFIIVILTLGGYIWKIEMAHVNKALVEIKASVNENNRRQWAEVTAVKTQVTQVNEEINEVLYRTNEMLYDVLTQLKGKTAHGASRHTRPSVR